MRDLFEEQPPPKPATPRVEPATQLATPPPAKPTPCTTRFQGHHKCRVGGGDACFSDDHGRTWFCAAHVPRGFFPADRKPK